MSGTHGVVVGYDGSDFAMQALEWATDEAELRHVPLTVVHAWSWPYGEARPEAKLHLRKAAEHVLWHGAECARNTSVIEDVRADLYEGDPVDRLVELSGDADLLVVGSRGLGRLPRLAVGSVATRVAADARCPVIVVRGPGPIPVPEHPGPVLLGVDGEPGEAVMRFAFEEAERRGLAVEAVRAADVRPMIWGPAAPPLLDSDALARAAGEDLLEAVEPWRERYPEVPCRARFVSGRPRDVMREESHRASLVVIGRRRTGHLGSLARTMLQHSACPVAVVAFEAVRQERETVQAGPRSAA